MLPDFAIGSLLWEAVFGVGILGVALVLALMVHPILTRVAKAVTGRTKTTLDDLIVDAISKPLFFFIIVHGVFTALTVSTFLNSWQDYINKAWLAAMLLVVVYGVQKVVNAIIKWYAQEVASKTKSQMDEKLLPMVRRFLTVTIYAIGILLILDNLGVKLSPLLAGLGLGGLAVALALQPTLSNFIASGYMVADASVGVGDFIEVQGGPSGVVQDIGWRTTKILTPVGNLVIIPNSKLVDSVVTNYQSPNPSMVVFIKCGVSYESDLARVEAVGMEVAQETINALPASVVDKSFKPVVLFQEFGDSNINFVVVLKAADRVGGFTVTHELIKRLHARFTKEGLEINYPVRKLVYAQQDGAQAPVLPEGRQGSQINVGRPNS